MNTPTKTPLPGFDTMAVILVVWLCSLPLIFLVVVPLLGIKAAATVAVAALLFMLIVCWGSCIPALIRLYIRAKRTQDEKLMLRENARRIK